MLTIPFENLDIHSGREIVLDEDSLLRKIIEKQRGGICYEVNAIFRWLLDALGFQVRMIAAEVFDDDGRPGPLFDHMALLVDIDGDQYLADVGFGDSFTSPLRLSNSSKQDQIHGTYRVEGTSDRFTVFAGKTGDGELAPSLRFSWTQRTLADFDAMCQFHQTSTRSPFTRREICSRATPTGRISLSGLELIETDGHLRTVTQLMSVDEKNRALAEHFGITQD